MNILFLIGHLNGGGAERIAGELSKCLEEKHTVKMVVFEDQGTTYPHCDDLENINLPGSEIKGINKIINLFRRALKVRKIKKKFKADVTISFQSNANLVNVVSGYSKAICSVRTVLSAIAKSKISRLIEGSVLRKSDLVVTLSDAVKNDLISNFCVKKTNIKTIYNFVSRNLEGYNKNKIINKSNKDHTTFCTMGRMVTAKGQWHLIKAFSQLIKEKPEARLKLFGEGPLENDLKKLAIDLGVREQVEFCGFKENPWIELSECDVFVFPSLWEGFGNALIEAMYCGLPIIAADCNGGIREIVNPTGGTEGDVLFGEYGILVPPFRVGDVSNDLRELELDEIEKILANAMKDICEKKTWEHYYKKSIMRAKDFSLNTISLQWLEEIEKLWV